MSNIFDTDKLIESVKRTAKVPDSQSEYTDQDILDIANEEFSTNLLAQILSKKETYYTINRDIPISDNTVKKYKLPNRSIGSKIEWVGFYSSNSNLIRELNAIPYDQLISINQYNFKESGYDFYFENEALVIDSTTPLNFDYLRFRFNIQPNKLVLTSRVSTITGIDSSSGIITVSATIPSNFTTTSKIDFIASDAPNNILDYDISLVDLNASAKYFQVDPDDIPDLLAVGDRICLAGESDVIYAPTEMHPVLANMVALKILEANGDDTSKIEKSLMRKQQAVDYLITNRDTSSPVKASVRRNKFKGRRF